MLTDDQIDSLLNEPKRLPSNWKRRLEPKRKENTRHAERQLEVERDAGGKFRIILRLNLVNLLDFSVILMFVDEKKQSWTLRRYNGRHPSGHSNKIERRRGDPNAEFRNTFHIHTATYRYQAAGEDIDGYAEPTTKYHDFKSALEKFLDGHNFQRPVLDDTGKAPLFGEEAVQ